MPSASGARMASCVCLLTILSTAAQHAQQFRSGVEMVALSVTVTNGRGESVKGLTAEDFAVYEDGVRQPVSLFGSSQVPLDVALMLDTSASMTGSIDLLKSAAEQFLIRLLPEDRGAVGAFNDKIELSGNFSSNRDALVADVKDLDYGNGTRLYDALAESLNALRGTEGRRVILVFTDGDDTSSRIGRGTILDRARGRSDDLRHRS